MDLSRTINNNKSTPLRPLQSTNSLRSTIKSLLGSMKRRTNYSKYNSTVTSSSSSSQQQSTQNPHDPITINGHHDLAPPHTSVQDPPRISSDAATFLSNLHIDWYSSNEETCHNSQNLTLDPLKIPEPVSKCVQQQAHFSANEENQSQNEVNVATLNVEMYTPENQEDEPVTDQTDEPIPDQIGEPAMNQIDDPTPGQVDESWNQVQCTFNNAASEKNDPKQKKRQNTSRRSSLASSSKRMPRLQQQLPVDKLKAIASMNEMRAGDVDEAFPRLTSVLSNGDITSEKPKRRPSTTEDQILMMKNHFVVVAVGHSVLLEDLCWSIMDEFKDRWTDQPTTNRDPKIVGIIDTAPQDDDAELSDASTVDARRGSGQGIQHRKRD